MNVDGTVKSSPPNTRTNGIFGGRQCRIVRNVIGRLGIGVHPRGAIFCGLVDSLGHVVDMLTLVQVLGNNRMARALLGEGSKFSRNKR